MKALAEKEAQAFKPAVCHPRAARLTLRVSNPGQGAQSLFYTTMPRGLALNGKKRLYRTSDWAWKGFAGIKNTMRNTPLTPQPNPQPNPQTTPPINETPPNNDKKTPFPIIVSQKTSETTVFGNSAASTYWKHSSCNERSHLFPARGANPQKTSETSVFGNSAASTYSKHSSCNEREPPLPNMMSQPTTNLWNQCVWQ